MNLTPKTGLSSSKSGKICCILDNKIVSLSLLIRGIHLKDTIALNAALPDYIAGDLVNIRKMAQLSLIFQELDDLARASPPLHADMDVVNTIRVKRISSYTHEPPVAYVF